MTLFTTNQWAILGLVLILGWLLGLASRSGAGRWRRAYETERSDRLKLQADGEARAVVAHARIAELERQVAMAAAAAPAAATASGGDDLSLIRGVGPSGAARLNDFGVHSYHDIATMSTDDEATLEGRMGAEPGFIARERWREQAESLAAARQRPAV